MNQIIVFYVRALIVLLLFASESTSTKSSPFMTTSELIELEGYPWEMHVVTTTDGYILKNYRIPGTDPKLYPVVLVHGLWSSGNDFLMKGKRSLPFLLAKNGFDVWILNLRWTREARHLNMSRADPSYWNFSMEESGIYDVPESIDRILDVTKSKKVIYIALSTGNAFYGILCDQNKELVDKFALQISFAFVWYSTGMQIPDSVDKDIWSTLANVGFYNIELTDVFRQLLMVLCGARSHDNFCYRNYFKHSGANWKNVDWTNSHLLAGRHMAISIKQGRHMQQILNLGNKVLKYDYGPAINMKKYGSPSPPKVKLGACKAPMILYHGINDVANSLNDTMLVADELRASGVKVEIRTPKSKTFGHMDFFTGTKDTDRLYKDVISVLKTLDYE